MSNDAYHPNMMEEALDGMRRKEIADLKAENERLTQFLQAATIRGGELIAELTEAQDLASHWSIAAQEAQHQVREQAEGHRKAAEFLRIERDNLRAELEQMRTDMGEGGRRLVMENMDMESSGKRLALELECLLMDCKDNVVVSRWWDSAHEALQAWSNLFPYNGPRLGD